MKNSTVLVTGANGLVGQLIWNNLSKPYYVRGIDVRGPFSDRVNFVDLSKYEQLSDQIEKIMPVDCIIHLAGQSSIHASWDDVLSANIVGTKNVYEAARFFGIRRVLFASTNHVTGAYEGFEPHLQRPNDPAQLNVETPIRPDSDYAVSKVFGEALARYYYDRWGIESICLRLGTVRPDDDPSSNPRFAMTWLSHRDLIQLIEKSISSDIQFGIYYGISNNREAFWDISNARRDLGYNPIDDAAEFSR